MTIDDINNVSLESLIPDIWQAVSYARCYRRLYCICENADNRNKYIASVKTLVADTMLCNEPVTVSGIKKTFQIIHKKNGIWSTKAVCRLIRYYSNADNR